VWSDAAGRRLYSESVIVGANKFLWDGTIETTADGPTAYTVRRRRNGVVIATESVERVKDSVIAVRDSTRTAAGLATGVVPVPGLVSAPVLMALLECTLTRPSHDLQTSRYGRLRLEEVGDATIHAGNRSQHVRLVLLRTNADDIVARVWLADNGSVVAYLFAESVMDLIRPEWSGARDQLREAEIRAASPNCVIGDGTGGCTPSARTCNMATSSNSPPQHGRTLTLSDSGYTIRGDGQGPYVADSVNVSSLWLGAVAGMELTPARRGQNPRYFVVDLDHPVPGDIGKRLGSVRVDGSLPGRFAPSGLSAGNELNAHANTDWDNQQHSLVEVPVGGSIAVDQIDLDFYINGVAHVLQMGPQPYDHCHAAGTAIFGDGTTTGTVSHPDANRWIVDLPPGSVGRLFENRHGSPTAINRGLYYISLHLVIQK
jgi:hypothetical protein